MDFNHQPNNIEIYRDFPLDEGEIHLFFKNDEKKNLAIYRRVLIIDSEFLPVAEGKLVALKENKQSVFHLPAGSELVADLLIDGENLASLAARQEYTVIIQYGRPEDFVWIDTMLDNMETFKNWDNQTGAALLDKVARLLPVKTKQLSFHTRPLLDGGKLDLCMDFGTSFSACALSINPAKSSSLACVRPGDTPASIFYTQFQTGEKDVTKRVVPSVMALKKIDSDDKATWLFGFDALNWVKNRPGKGSFISDIKSRLLDLKATEVFKDQDGKGREFTNREIVREFLNYLVQTSKSYFGVNFDNIHITTPVNYPDRQRRAYETLLKEDLGFSRLKNKLDEARAPLYHFLAGKVEKCWNGALTSDEGLPSKPEGKLSYLIIDCGGGSTDATLVRDIRLKEPKRAGGGIIMETEDPRPDGNPDFGGTDLTTLLYHYVKMRLVAKLLPEEWKKLGQKAAQDSSYLIDSLIEPQDKDLFWELYQLEQDCRNEDIPAKQHNFAYGNFEKLAAQVEKLLPTDTRINQMQDQKTWEKINSNHNTLWQLAEQLKVAIFTTDAPKTINIHNVPNTPKISFWLRDNENAELVHFGPEMIGYNFVFNSYELTKLFKPIIFKEMSRILRSLNVRSDLKDDENIFNVRFVGQSTNIPIFNDAVAFFVPRVMIEEEKWKYEDKGESRFQPIPAEEKKICCVTGAANFLDHLSRGCLKDDRFVAGTHALRNFCRFGKDGRPINAGVYDAQGKPSQVLVQRGTPLANARGAIVRDLADDMEEYFGTTYDEIIKEEGFINFSREDMSKALNDAEKEELEKRWGELLKQLQIDPDDPGVLVQAEILEEDTSQHYEFRPYFWDKATKKYYTTPKPLTI